MNLMLHFNPACMKQLFLASAAQGVSQAQEDEKYTAIVVSQAGLG